MFIINNLASAVSTLLSDHNIEFSRAFSEDINFIATLDGESLIQNMELKGAAVTKINSATELMLEKSASSGGSPNNSGTFRLTKGSQKISRTIKSGSSKFERPLKDKPTSKEKVKKEKEKTLREKKPNFIEKRQHSVPTLDINSTSQLYYDEDTEDIKYTYADESYPFPKVKAASIDKLIERLTHEVYPGMYCGFMEGYED